MNVAFMRYSGSKFKYTKIINQYIKTDNDLYVEPFIGSGSVFFNLEKTFKKYVINDVDRNIIRIYKSFKDISYDNYIIRLNYINDNFGCIKTNKDSFYKFRNWFNKNHWNSDSLDEGVYLHILANSCMNSFFRVGPNGFNAAFGNRLYILSKNDFDHIKHKLQNTIILNLDYKKVFNMFPCAFYFLDPPYFSQTSSYKGFTENEFLYFLENIKTKEFLYTDILNKYNKDIPNKMLIREMISTSPSVSKKQKNGNMEYLFSSNELKTNFINW